MFRPWRYSDPAFATLVGVLAVALQKSTSYHDRPSGCFDRAQASRDRLPTDRRPENDCVPPLPARSEEHTSELQSLMRISYAVFCLKKKKQQIKIQRTTNTSQE